MVRYSLVSTEIIMLRFAILAAPLLIAAAPVRDQSGTTEKCQRIGDGLHEAVATPGQNGAHRLDQLPPANEYLTVLSVKGGCVKSVIVNYNVGRTKQP